MTRLRILLALLSVPALNLSSEIPCRAQTVTAIAEQLFRDGRALLEAGRIDEACDKLAASQRLAPALGTQLNLAICREQQGKTATAWSMFADVEAAALRNGDGARASVAQRHEAALAGKLKKIVIEVPAPPPGMIVKLDGTALPAGALGTEIPLDPGTHDLVVAAPGKKTWEQANIELGPSATTVHVRVEIEEMTPSSPPSAGDAAPTAAGPAPEAERSMPGPGPDLANVGQPSTSAAPIQRSIGFAVGAAGIVTLGFATYYAVTAISRKSDESNYPSGAQARLTVYDQAQTAQTWAYALGGLGVGAVGAGLFLVLTSPSRASSTVGWTLTPSVGREMAGADLRVRF